MKAMIKDFNLIKAAMDCGASNAAIIGVRDIPFRPEFRDMCEMNSCGKFGRCWMCPPDVGPIDAMIEQAKGYKNALVFQSIGLLEDSFDIEGMQQAAKYHNSVLKAFRDEYGAALNEPLFLGAGACQMCEECTRLSGAPCCSPELAVASLEAYGIAVSELAELCDIKYANGANTVTYFAAVLYN